MAKISFITTVFNEEKNIENFLNSLFNQSIKPAEIIIVDAGSTDKTVQIIKNLKCKIKNCNFKLKILIEEGINRSEGRNLGIKNVSGEIIAVSDAGCLLDRKWLENISKPLQDPQIDVVAGFYQPVGKNIFQQCLACYTSVFPDQVRGEAFLPSSRSIAFRKKAWQKVGGYPENLNYCEDLVFAKRLKDAGFHFQFSPESLVYWPQRENILEAFTQFAHYASGDVQALYRPHLKKISLVFFRYIIGLLIAFQLSISYSVILLFGYLARSVWKNYRYVRRPLAFIYLPLLQIVADLALMSGATSGLIKKTL